MTRILIVEDEESYREPLVYQLTREGYDVSAAATGEEGLELFTKGGIDLVLLDLMLPGLDGTALCRRIREQSRVPIIMLTAKSAEIDKVVGLEIGADDYITKPYSFRELLARVRAVLRRNQMVADATESSDDDLPAEGIRASRISHAEQGPCDDPPPADRPHLGVRLRWRHQNVGCARQACPFQNRGGSGASEISDHRAWLGLQN